MASVIREGGKEPIVVNSWQTSAKDVMLDKFYDENHRGAFVHDVADYVERRLDHKSVEKKYMHRVILEDVKRLAGEMFADDWIEVSDFDLCDLYQCRQKRNVNFEHILQHARLRLTEKGYNKVQEHIFP